MAEQQRKKSLLKFEKPIYRILRSSDLTEKELLIHKMMASKPKIMMPDKSPLLERLHDLMPMFKKSQEELELRVPQIHEQIDAKLELCDSSSEDDSDRMEEDNAMEEESGSKLQSCGEVQFQLLRYPLYEQERDDRENREDRDDREDRDGRDGREESQKITDIEEIQQLVDKLEQLE